MIKERKQERRNAEEKMVKEVKGTERDKERKKRNCKGK